MKKEKHLGKLNMIVSGIILVLSIAIFFAFGTFNNNRKRVFEGTLNEGHKSFDVNLNISKSWFNGEENNYGQQFDFVIDNHKKYDLKNWSLTVNFDSDYFEFVKVDDAWNVDYVEDGKTLTIKPHTDIDLVNISPKENNSFGFIFILKNKITEGDFSDFTYSLNGTMNRKFISYPVFWVFVVLVITYIAAVVSFTIISVREKNFEKFKEQSYSIISQSMNTFASFIDTKDPYTRDHSARVSYYSVKIARKLGLDDEYVRNIAYISLMHDCGKLLIPDEILTKPAKLTIDEYSIMKQHTTYGGKALENLTAIKDMQDGAMYHHERYDGNGYPKGLKGEEIPLCARIIGVADALDAMSSDRCYRARLSKEKILSELEECSGKQFDPKIAALVVEMINSGEIDIDETR